MLRILLTGGGTGGHIYPLVAVANEIFRLAAEQNRDIEMRYFGVASVLNKEFENRGIRVEEIISSKLRRYFSLNNFIDIPKFILSLFQTLFKIFWFMPDVVFSKGGPGALAVILAARFYRIPIFIHESDTAPGLTNFFSARFAQKIFISFEKTTQYFPAGKTTILVGNPIRPEILREIPDKETAKKTLGFDSTEPLILVIGGSQGALRINNFILDNLGEILDFAQIIHQSGSANFLETKRESDLLIKNLGDFYRMRYQLVGYLENVKSLREVFSAADLILSRAGSGAIFEIAAFGKPSILIPIPEEVVGEHQIINAYEYAKTGAAVVLEEANFKLAIFINQAKKVLTDLELQNKISQAAKNFAKPDAAQKIAKEILKLISIQ